jgi:Tfp pilus assembly protein PilF
LSAGGNTATDCRLDIRDSIPPPECRCANVSPESTWSQHDEANSIVNLQTGAHRRAAGADGRFGLRWRQTNRQTPSSLWARAVSADQAEDGATAELLLRKLLRIQPDNAAAHGALAELYPSAPPEVGASGRPKLDPRVLAQLQEVVRLQPTDVGMHLRLMHMYFDAGRLKSASDSACKSVELGTDDRLALYLAAYHALEVNDKTMLEEIVAKLKNEVLVPNFRIAVLLTRIYQTTTEKALLATLIDRAFEHTVRMQPVMLEALPPEETAAFRELVVLGVNASPDGKVAHLRAGEALTVLDQLSTVLKSDGAPRQIAGSAARVMLTLLDRYPIAPEAVADEKQTRDGLIKLARQLIRAVLDDAEAPVTVPLAEARLALQSGDEAAALVILERGVTSLESLPAARRGDVAQLRVLAAQQLLRKQKFAEAERHVESLRKHAETSGLAEMLAGAIALEERRFDDAVTALRLARVNWETTCRC